MYMKRALVDAMTDGIADGIGFSKQARWGKAEPECEDQDGGKGDE
jgi:hypothetical protein